MQVWQRCSFHYIDLLSLGLMPMQADWNVDASAAA
jgi:hypothetical protein